MIVKLKDEWTVLLAASAAGLLLIRAEGAPAETRPKMSDTQAIELARAYIADEDPANRAEILKQVEGWSERLDDIALALRPVPPPNAPTGYIRADRFTVPRLRARMARILPTREGPVLLHKEERFQPAPGEEYLNWVYVPETYDPGKPMGLVIQMHGGGGGNAQVSASHYLESDGYAMRDLLHGRDFITVCPSTPPMYYDKWSFPESEIQIQSIIEEYSTRYHIDPDRVYLMGCSMGGIGSWWHAFRESDRFTLIAPMAGTWRTAYFPGLRGTFLYLLNGAFDHHTHVDFHRHAHRRLTALDIPHFDAEYTGAHARALGRPQMEALFELIPLMKRDPYTPHVCAISPYIPTGVWGGGESERRRYPSSPHSFWASVLETGPDGVPVECAVRNERNVLTCFPLPPG
ncbi:MAG: hypothetical protein HY321_11510 [Armatimonadetes bacterium]|nr:hypothetical protein [Armatimonadota bacterium]